jgi:hypothetical protein
VRQRLWFQHYEAPAYYGENVQQWLNVGISKKVDRPSSADCIDTILVMALAKIMV